MTTSKTPAKAATPKAAPKTTDTAKADGKVETVAPVAPVHATYEDSKAQAEDNLKTATGVPTLTPGVLSSGGGVASGDHSAVIATDAPKPEDTPEPVADPDTALPKGTTTRKADDKPIEPRRTNRPARVVGDDGKPIKIKDALGATTGTRVAVTKRVWVETPLPGTTKTTLTLLLTDGGTVPAVDVPALTARWDR